MDVAGSGMVSHGMFESSRSRLGHAKVYLACDICMRLEVVLDSKTGTGIVRGFLGMIVKDSQSTSTSSSFLPTSETSTCDTIGSENPSRVSPSTPIPADGVPGFVGDISRGRAVEAVLCVRC